MRDHDYIINQTTDIMNFVPITEMCVALNFINDFGSPFKLYSSLKHEGYLVIGSGFKLKLAINRPELHSHVTFYAVDPAGKRKILLNGVKRISEPAISGCPKFVDVLVTSGQGFLILFFYYYYYQREA